MNGSEEDGLDGSAHDPWVLRGVGQGAIDLYCTIQSEHLAA
jgi:hypothetical protein